jgi:hypothetical protein
VIEETPKSWVDAGGRQNECGGGEEEETQSDDAEAGRRQDGSRSGVRLTPYWSEELRFDGEEEW